VTPSSRDPVLHPFLYEPALELGDGGQDGQADRCARN
jgi:hypothetical protein